MSIVVSHDSRVVIQGMTGREGRFHATAMLRYGTKVVAGVTPGKGGQQVARVPIYDTVRDAVNYQRADTSILFVPPRFTRDAVLEAIDAGIKTLVVITEFVPQKDTIEFIARAGKEGNVMIIGPNTPGVINPGLKIHIGVMPAHVFKPGVVGIASRSGTLTYEVARHISMVGLGQSTCVGVGGDPIVGLDFVRVLEMFKDDEETRGVVLIGEIGGNAEELAAGYISKTHYPKPVVSYIAGRLAPPEKRIGHAGAIIQGNTGSARSKIDALTAAGVPVADKPSDVVRLLRV